jgi:hypothetical protein
MDTMVDSDQNQKAEQPATLKDYALGLGCFCIIGLILLYVGFGVYRHFNPSRPENLPKPVRVTQTAEEKKIRREYEEYAKSAAWGGDQGKENPLEHVGTEVRPGVSSYAFCNRSGRNMTLYFDGTEIFKVDVPSGASVLIELKSGVYDHLIVAPGGQASIMLKPYYHRVTLNGAYHDLFAVRGEQTAPCPGQHEVIRKAP